MTKSNRNAEREERISMEIVVDAYGPEEQAMGWYYYLADTMQFPFTATCIQKRSTSPIKLNDTVEVVGMADEGDCEYDMFVEIDWGEGDRLAIPLAQISAVPDTDEDTQQAIADWHYWIDSGYQFG